MKESIKLELCEYILDAIQDEVITDDMYQDDWHFHLFNEDYYVIGYYQAEQWLKKHDLSAFEAIGDCMEYEKYNFGEVSKVYDNAETTVNMYVYIQGEDLLADADAEDIDSLREYCEYALSEVAPEKRGEGHHGRFD